MGPTAYAPVVDTLEYGLYSIFAFAQHVAMHDMLHAYRIEELLLKRDWE